MNDTAMHFLSFVANWILIVFLWGGLGVTITYAVMLSPHLHNSARLNVRTLRTAILILPAFIILATISAMDLSRQTFRPPLCFVLQFLVNLLTGISFLLFLRRLWKSIEFGTNDERKGS